DPLPANARSAFPSLQVQRNEGLAVINLPRSRFQLQFPGEDRPWPGRLAYGLTMRASSAESGLSSGTHSSPKRYAVTSLPFAAQQRVHIMTLFRLGMLAWVALCVCVAQVCRISVAGL